MPRWQLPLLSLPPGPLSSHRNLCLCWEQQSWHCHGGHAVTTQELYCFSEDSEVQPLMMVVQSLHLPFSWQPSMGGASSPSMNQEVLYSLVSQDREGEL